MRGVVARLSGGAVRARRPARLCLRPHRLREVRRVAAAARHALHGDRRRSDPARGARRGRDRRLPADRAQRRRHRRAQLCVAPAADAARCRHDRRPRDERGADRVQHPACARRVRGRRPALAAGALSRRPMWTRRSGCGTTPGWRRASSRWMPPSACRGCACRCWRCRANTTNTARCCNCAACRAASRAAARRACCRTAGTARTCRTKPRPSK